MRKAMDIATLGCSVNVKLAKDKQSIDQLRIAFGVAAPIPIRTPKAEELAKGETITKALIDRIGEAVLEDVNPRSSWRASKEFRLQLIEELAKRATVEAIKKAGGTINV